MHARFFLLKSSLNSSIPFFPAFYDKQIISYQRSQKLDCDTVLSAGPMDCLIEICLISKIRLFAMLVVGLSCFGHVLIEYLEILWLKSLT